MRDEVVDVGLDQGVAASRAAVVLLPATVARQLQQLAAAFVEDGAEQILLAGEDGVDRPHRQPDAAWRCPAPSALSKPRSANTCSAASRMCWR